MSSTIMCNRKLAIVHITQPGHTQTAGNCAQQVANKTTQMTKVTNSNNMAINFYIAFSIFVSYLVVELTYDRRSVGWYSLS